MNVAAAGGRASVPEGPQAAETRALPDREARVLAFEGACVVRGYSKAAAIRAQFGMSQARYYQVLNALIDSHEALAADPVLVHRLQRLREARLAGRRIGGWPTERERNGR